MNTTRFCTYLLLFSAFVVLVSVETFAINSTFLTYTLSGNGKWKITQDAYVVSRVLFKDLDLYYPEDIFIWSGKMYIADSGNARIVVYELETGKTETIGESALWQPTGVFVTDEYVYVADPGSSEVVIFDHSGTEISRIGRPTSPLFGETANFKPKKLAVDKRGNLYVVSEGTFEGIIQLDRNGEFLGYFGANMVGLTFIDKFIDLFYTKEQKAKLLNRIPKPYTNLTIDSKGLIYTVTQKERGNAIKKHNTLGNNILYNSRERRMVDEENFTDIAVDKSGRMYALTETGLIYEYDQEGNLIFSFGGRAIATERNGLFSVAVAIEVDDEGRIYVLDRERGLVHVFTPTEYACVLHKALDLFSAGKYRESLELWKSVLVYDGYSQIAHYGLGKAYFQMGDYRNAALHFKEAFVVRDLSDAYWEIRNEFVQKNVELIFGLFLIFIVLTYLLGRTLLRKKSSWISVRENKLIRDVLYIKNMIKHPIDTYYYLQKGKHGSILSASIIYVWFLATVLLDYFGRSFIFNLNTQERTLGFAALTTMATTGLWIFSNWLVSSINDGKGTLRDIYLFTAYAMAPYVMFQPFVIASTYVLTLNEKFLVDFSSIVIIFWCAVLIYLGVKEIHDYEIRDTFKSIVMSFAWIFVIILVYSIVYMLWDRLVETVYEIVQEVLYRVRAAR